MKSNFKSIIAMAAVGIAFTLAHPSAAPAAATVVIAPQIVMTPVPDSYVWDGSEYVGVVGGQYYYLGPGNVWVVMDPARMHRFHGWEQGHPNWQVHATHNARYRTMDHGPRPQPMRTVPQGNPNHNPPQPVNPGHHGP